MAINDTTGGKQSSEAQAIIEHVVRANKVEIIPIPGSDVPVAALPTSTGRLHDLLPFVHARAEHPRRARGASKHTTWESFAAHVRRHGDSDSTVIFAHETSGKLTAIYDYNEASRVLDKLEGGVADWRYGVPGFGVHTAIYTMPITAEWRAWNKLNDEGAWLAQRDFAELLEERILEVPPSDVTKGTQQLAATLGIELGGPSTLVTLARGMSVRADRRIASSQVLSSGESKLTFEETHATTTNDGKPLVVPAGFAITVPVFEGEAAYGLLARLRYKIDGNAVKWRVALHRPELVYRDAFLEIVARSKQLGFPVFVGEPEPSQAPG